LPDAIFQTKNINLGKFWRVLQLKGPSAFEPQLASALANPGP
jgi:hypothetical protein